MKLRVLIAVPLLALLVSCGEDEPSGTGCEYPASGEPAKAVNPPPETVTETGKVVVTMSTTAGDLTLTLDAENRPCTVNSFLSLADQNYFNDTPCHRLTTAGIFVLQCGDPTATGTGGPGYQFADELVGEETYPAGVLAMANAGPDTNGSQFFLVYKDTELAPNYTVFGTFDAASIKVLQAVAAEGTVTPTDDGPPRRRTVINSIIRR